jgi:hypothetical protein
MTHWENRLVEVEKGKRTKGRREESKDLPGSGAIKFSYRACPHPKGRRRPSAAEFCSQMAQAGSSEIIPTTLMEEQGRRLQNFHGLI